MTNHVHGPRHDLYSLLVSYWRWHNSKINSPLHSIFASHPPPIRMTNDLHTHKRYLYYRSIVGTHHDKTTHGQKLEVLQYRKWDQTAWVYTIGLRYYTHYSHSTQIEYHLHLLVP
jgi:hypothetical protein